MTQEEKELLLRDLYARLPYSLCVQDEYGEIDYINYNDVHFANYFDSILNGKVKPYLRPMSSMTEEEFTKLKEYSGLKYDQLDLASFQNGTYKCLDFYLSEVPSVVVIKVFDWLNRYHFDYRNLIQIGLAIAVTKENNPYKE